MALASACSDGPSAPRTGIIAVTIEGVPSVNAGAVTIRGPLGGNSVTRDIQSTQTLENLAPGRYLISAGTVTNTVGTYVPVVAQQQVDVTASLEPVAITVAFQIQTGSLHIDVSGLPQGLAAAITVAGPAGFQRLVTATETLANLQPGSYQISSSAVTENSGHVFSPTPIGQNVTVVASETPRNVNARYAIATGALDVRIGGLPEGQGGDVIVTGPAGFRTQLANQTTLIGLFPGTYSVTAKKVGEQAGFLPILASQNVEIPPSVTPVVITVDYVKADEPPPPSFNLTIDGMYLTQAIQTYQWSVPLLANRPGLVRVFVKASAPNTVGTTVRLRVYNGLALQQTITMLPNVPGVPTQVTEGTLGSSWNALIPSSLIQPGLRLLADVDPGNAVAESNENDNTFPADAVPYTPQIESPAPLRLTIVPVLQTATGLAADVSPGNVEAYLEFARKIFPITEYQVSLHETFTSSAPALESNDGNGGWFQVLGEINALRVAEGSTDYYAGIVRTPYTSGVVGIAFTPGKAAISWDNFPLATQVLAHELGHSLGRRHAPCGGVVQADPLYPYPFGVIGSYGYDQTTGQLKPPGTSDIMGYCGFGWISDYNYLGILNYRKTSPAIAASATSQRLVVGNTKQQTLVVWGRIVDGVPILEPSFTATAPASVPSGAGPYRIEATANNGRTIFSAAFAGEETADVSGRQVIQFAFAIPMSDIDRRSLQRIRLTTADGRSHQLQADAATPGTVESIEESAGQVRIRLIDSRSKLAVVRNRATQRIVGFVRPGPQGLLLRSTAPEFDVEVADGVQSQRRIVRPVKR